MEITEFKRSRSPATISECGDQTTCGFVGSSKNNLSFQVITLGLNRKWEGGDMSSYGGGYKVNLLKEAVEELDDQHKDSIILFTDRYVQRLL